MLRKRNAGAGDIKPAGNPQARALANAPFKTRSTIILDMPPPLLVVEVVSPGKRNRDRDYRFKRSEYAARGIAHYWIIDPQEQKFICLELQDGLYESVFNSSTETISIIQPFALDLNFKNIFIE